jgi:hypothetical protein
MIAKEKDVLVDLLQKQEGRQVQSRFLALRRETETLTRRAVEQHLLVMRSEPAPEKVGDTPT